MKSDFRMNRRTCLKAIGASLALPFMESVSWADAAKGKSYKPPVRLGFMYMPHGVIMDQFWPKDAESFLSSPPPALESLRPIIDQRSEEHTSELQSRLHLVCRLLLEKKKRKV